MYHFLMVTKTMQPQLDYVSHLQMNICCQKVKIRKAELLFSKKRKGRVAVFVGY
jgi:hypothetical protein